MEGIATIGARSVLNSVASIAASLITSEVDSLLGVSEELGYIRRELAMMQSFLLETSTGNIRTPTEKTWVEDVKDLAYDTEDCLQKAYGVLIKKGFLRAMLTAKKRDCIAREIRSLRNRLKDLNDGKDRFMGKMETVIRTNSDSASKRSVANLEDLVVGLDEAQKELVELTLKEQIELRDEPWKGQVISVVGMGGLGKTTLVRKVFGCQQLRDHEFKYFTWVTVLHPFNTEEFIENLAKQIPSDAEEPLRSSRSIVENVTVYLRDNKYLIVLDDLSSLSEWEKIKDIVFPMGRGSRIIVTTRYRKPLAESISHPSENIYEIKKLSEEDAFDLFYKAVYRTHNYQPLNDESSKITESMKMEAVLIIERCGRLPLALANIGTYLSTKPKTSTDWKTMLDHFSSELGNNPYLGVLKPVLSSSYDGMPYRLKLCLLYLSVFHNHKEIRRSRIIRRWMADGYVMQDRDKMAEEVGKEYFYDLMGRSLIQPSEMNITVNGEVKRCDIHAMMYQLIFTMAVDENTVTLIKAEKVVTRLKDENNITKGDKVRHLVITGGPCTWDSGVLANVNFSHVRSISIFGKAGDFHGYPRMRLVRVLDLEGTLDLNNRDLRSVGKLRHLQYLGLRGTKITELPDSLGKLSELETLDIRNTAVVRLPAGVAMLQKLSYLRAGYDRNNNLNIRRTRLARGIHKIGNVISRKPLNCWPQSIGVRATREIGELRSLQILGMINIGRSKGLAEVLKNLINLRKLAVTGFSKKNGKSLAKVIDGLEHLKSLVLSSADDSGLSCCLESVSSPPKYLKSLKLYSPLGELPLGWINSLENLKKMHLRNTYLSTELKDIGNLRNLIILYISGNSFKDGKALCFCERTFPLLQVLIFEGIQELESVSISNEALKRLEQLYIRKCWSIGQKGVSGLEFLIQLKEVEVVVSRSPSDETFVSNLQEKISTLPKGPSLKVFKVERPADDN